MTDVSQHRLSPDLVLDAERAAWFSGERVLAVADAHLGFVWAQRSRGQLLPVSAPDNTLERLLGLQEKYRPERIVFLGDTVHRAVPLEQIEKAFAELCRELARASSVTLLLGNHDRGLMRLIEAAGLGADAGYERRVGNHLLLHGDQELSGRTLSEAGFTAGSGRVVIGHEHPAIELGDGLAARVKVPCFLISDDVLVLPAFSQWAAGVAAGRRGQAWMSPIARAARFKEAVAIVGGKLLRVRLS